jgi:hypothetical protein
VNELHLPRSSSVPSLQQIRLMTSLVERGEEGYSRRGFLKQAGIAAGGLVTVGGAGFGVSQIFTGSRQRYRPPLKVAHAPVRSRSYHSRPDLHPPGVSIATAGDPEPGYVFLGPGAAGRIQAGPLMLDQDGEAVWFSPLTNQGWIANFRAWTLEDRPVLAWWKGEVMLPLGYGKGEAVIVDDSYQELRRIRPIGSQPMDVHELRLTNEGTALFTCYPRTVERDLTVLGGPRRAPVLESVIQEVDIRSGRLLLEWRSLDHIAVEESYRPFIDPYDYLHINSIAVCPDGNLLVAGRHTWAIYKLDRRSGEVMWRLGGKRSDYAMGRGAQFSWQHDAEQADASTISLFDDGSDGKIKTASESRGLVLAVDDVGKRVSVAHEYRHPESLLSSSMGSVQVLPGGNVVVGWGSEPYLSEFAADGRLVADVRMPHGEQSYRGFRLPWRGTPDSRPAIAVRRREPTGDKTLYASWNGATEVAHWHLWAGGHRSNLRGVRTFPRRGFETAIGLGSAEGWVAVTALDSAGRQLAESHPIRVRD